MSNVWFFLVEVEALPGGDLYVPGSRCLVQCCVPGHSLEKTIPLLDEFLLKECYRRLDISIARRYNTADPEEEFPEVAEKAIRNAAALEHPTFGVFVHSKDSASFLNRQDANEKPQKKKRKRFFQ